jgi:hypothetical protein
VELNTWWEKASSERHLALGMTTFAPKNLLAADLFWMKKITKTETVEQKLGHS